MCNYPDPDTCKACGGDINPDEDNYVMVGAVPFSPPNEALPMEGEWFFYHGSCYPKALTAEIESLRLRYR